ncbi:MAG TPA: cytidine deaminase [Nocardioidaceae bacterium]|jgi:cytidine deaminase|nr:cytidine deaminase [Nocardioidaceae bacterium]
MTTAPLDSEDAKLVTLARASRVRTSAREGAAVRDSDGRTYVACTVDLASLHVSALSLAVATAVSSGAQGVEAAAVVTDVAEVSDADLSAVRDLGGDGLPVHRADADGVVQATIST